ncbi:hypothetical protein NORO109296_22460 [Nocardiopsis rhodophaea]
MVLRHYRDGTSPAVLAPHHGIGRSTDEGFDVLAEKAPHLHYARQDARSPTTAHLVLGGIAIPSDSRGCRPQESPAGRRSSMAFLSP